MTVEIMIGPMHGASDPPNIAVTFKSGNTVLMRVEMTPEAFALAVTGRLVHGEITRASAKGLAAVLDQPA